MVNIVLKYNELKKAKVVGVLVSSKRLNGGCWLCG
jgi:hypothetical protein